MRHYYTLPLSLIFAFVSSIATAETLTLQQAEYLALHEEHGLINHHLQSNALKEKSVAESQLMDPKIMVGINNLPTDTFDFEQEPMTQLKVSYIQKFPSGDTLSIKEKKALKQSDLMLSKADERQLNIIKEVRLAFLEIVYWEQAKTTILKNKTLFNQLIDIVQSLFSVGRNNQQDLINVQLGLSRLDDRLAKIEQKIAEQRTKLSRWIGYENSQKTLHGVTPNLPETINSSDEQLINDSLIMHPKIRQLDHQILIKRKDIQLVEESLNSGWALNVSYGYRGDDQNGNDRADFISAAATFDLPLFTEKRQDKKRLAKEYEYQALKNQRLDALKSLSAKVKQHQANDDILLKRQSLYQTLLLPQAKQQSEAALTSYQSDRGNFSDVMKAYMDDLNAQLDGKRIETDLLKTQANLLYFLPAFN